MPFECKKFHGQCKARCCGVVPIKLAIWKKNSDLIQRKVIEEIHGTSKEGDVLIPVTEDLFCPFLKKDLNCAIYEERPDVCRKFGDESHELLCCPVQDKDGNARFDLGFEIL